MSRFPKFLLAAFLCLLQAAQFSQAGTKQNTLHGTLELTGADADLIFLIFRENSYRKGILGANFELRYTCHESHAASGKFESKCGYSPVTQGEDPLLTESAEHILMQYMQEVIGYRVTKADVVCRLVAPPRQLECTISDISVYANGWYSWPRQ